METDEKNQLIETAERDVTGLCGTIHDATEPARTSEQDWTQHNCTEQPNYTKLNTTQPYFVTQHDPAIRHYTKHHARGSNGNYPNKEKRR